jgi:xylulose-5-phosphate/fructose-6-phosphate phosphoketolase
MAGQIVSQSNPPADPSQLPPKLSELFVKLDCNVLSKTELKEIKDFRNVANYIAAGQLHLTYAHICPLHAL